MAYLVNPGREPQRRLTGRVFVALSTQPLAEK